MSDEIGDGFLPPETLGARFSREYEAEQREFRKENVLQAAGTLCLTGAILAQDHISQAPEAGLFVAGGAFMATSLIRPLIRRHRSHNA